MTGTTDIIWTANGFEFDYTESMNNKLYMHLCTTWDEVKALDARGEAVQSDIGCWDMPDGYGYGGTLQRAKDVGLVLSRMITHSKPRPDGDQIILNVAGDYLFITPELRNGS